MHPIFKFIIPVLGFYLLLCLGLFFFQSKFLFNPDKLTSCHHFQFDDSFQEVYLKTNDGIQLHGLHFLAKEAKGAVLFFHGNGRNVDNWGKDSKIYTDQNYDVFYLDYRGFGKSEGKIRSERQLFSDAQLAYNYLTDHFTPEEIIISGTSIGSGIAAKIASENPSQLLILNTPYYSLKRLIKEKLKIIPGFIIKYRLETHKFLKKVSCPIVIFHGDNDELIQLDHPQKLQAENPDAVLHVIEGAGHSHLDLFKREQYLSLMLGVLD